MPRPNSEGGGTIDNRTASSTIIYGGTQISICIAPLGLCVAYRRYTGVHWRYTGVHLRYMGCTQEVHQRYTGVHRRYTGVHLRYMGCTQEVHQRYTGVHRRYTGVHPRAEVHVHWKHAASSHNVRNHRQPLFVFCLHGTYTLKVGKQFDALLIDVNAPNPLNPVFDSPETDTEAVST